MLPQACTQLAKFLGRSLRQYDVYEDGGRNPLESVASAPGDLSTTAELAMELGMEPEKAQSLFHARVTARRRHPNWGSGRRAWNSPLVENLGP